LVSLKNDLFSIFSIFSIRLSLSLSLLVSFSEVLTDRTEENRYLPLSLSLSLPFFSSLLSLLSLSSLLAKDAAGGVEPCAATDAVVCCAAAADSRLFVLRSKAPP
jgi:hypothetical protein